MRAPTLQHWRRVSPQLGKGREVGSMLINQWGQGAVSLPPLSMILW
jgi:hypothetical protein